ncbi:MAG: DUF2793 domain-containing protein [Rhodobacteraceae bacterium]|nr:DUF2793 domain-containing protein [Paracoccaceae bacterium]
MPDTSPRLDLPLLLPSQAQKHVTHNEALMRLDTLVQLTVQALDAETPPAAPAAGQAFGLGPAPVAGWAGQAGRLAVWDGVAWAFATPDEGWRAFDLTAGRVMVFSAGAWGPVAPDPQNLDGVGIGTTSDPVNRLAVAGDATLLSHGGSDHRLKINKATAGDTASLLFQSGWTGHAEMGLAGDSAFAIKVSADGIGWSEALRADPAAQTVSWAPAGNVRMALSDSGLHLDVPVTGTAVQSGPTDSAAGRLMAVGAFGLGAAAPAGIADFTTALRPGFYRADEATVTGGPAGCSLACKLHIVVMRGDDGVSLLMTRQTADVAAQRAWIGTRGGATGAVTWQEIPLPGRWLGTVSQSGGTPTGAIIERGSNANGEYVRFADGTQTCRAAKAPVTLDETWTFPAAFSTTSGLVLLGAGRTSMDATSVSFRPPSTTSAVFNHWLHDGTLLSSYGCSIMAIGRWF